MGHASKVRDAFGYLYVGELETLRKLARALPPDSVIVNIGAGAGTSGLTFVEANGDALLYTVDIQAESSPYGSLAGERNAFRDAGYMHLLDHSWFQIHGDSVEVGEKWRQNLYPLVDLLFIDGNHTYEGCAGDIRTWLPCVAPKGLIAVHDYRKAEHDPTERGRSQPYPGVDRAVDELLYEKGYALVEHVETLIVFRKERK